jgi:hypothetical protein
MYFGFDDLMGAQRAYEKLLTRQWSNQSEYKQILEERKNLFIRRIKILRRKSCAENKKKNSASLPNVSNIDVTKSSASFYTWMILVMRPPVFFLSERRTRTQSPKDIKESLRFTLAKMGKVKESQEEYEYIEKDKSRRKTQDSMCCPFVT